MKRIKLTVAYEGTDYCGWQVQPNGITIEEVLNHTLSKVFNECITVVGASRTDSGVHAFGNVAVFDTDSTIPPERMKYVINRELPEDIAIVESREVEADFHPRYAKTMKTYEYQICNSEIAIPTKRKTHYFVSYPLDVKSMIEASKYMEGTHDFASFCSSNSDVIDTVRTVEKIEIYIRNQDITIRVRGNGFLYNMVRIIVGTLVEVGRGFKQATDVKAIIDSQDRKLAGPTAPPQGLFLCRIEYE